MAHFLSDRDLFTWCEHGTPIGHSFAPWVPECHHCPDVAAR